MHPPWRRHYSQKGGVSNWKVSFRYSDPRGLLEKATCEWRFETNENLSSNNRTSLVVQWLRLHAANEGGSVWSLVRKLDPICHKQRSHMLSQRLKVPHGTIKTQYCQINICLKKKKQWRGLREKEDLRWENGSNLLLCSELLYASPRHVTACDPKTQKERHIFLSRR